MEIDAKVIKDLREKTGAGVMDCKKALGESGGNLEKAVVWLREKGIASAAKRASRVASEGTIGSYIHLGGKLGVLVEVNCETDFAAKGADFQTLVKEIAMQIAATNPRCVRREELAPEIIEQERQIYAQQSEGKPANVVNKIVEGKLEKFYKEVCLLEQPWVKDSNLSITDLIGEYTAKINEKLEVRRFARFQLGEATDQKNATEAG
ncbi:MAG TPA: translation elongation factor Ts [Candidatus Binataceae bacterium]|nr:translation elongation factor Ts [Candidatus Binataceae bacterium]